MHVPGNGERCKGEKARVPQTNTLGGSRTEEMEFGAEFVLEGKLYVLLFTGYWRPRAAMVAVALQIKEYK